MCGHTSTVTRTVTRDSDAPVPDAQSLPVLELSCSGEVTAPTADAGAITGVTTDPTSFTAGGEYHITWTYTDGAGNSSSQTQTVRVAGCDTTPPVLICGLPVIADNDAGKCSATVSPGDAIATDASGIKRLWATRADGATDINNGSYPVGSTVIEWHAEDNAGNPAAPCTQVVVVKDVEAPKLTVVAPLPVAPVAGQTMATAPAIEVSSVSDNCESATTSQTPAAGQPVAPGANNIAVTATDAAGNSASAAVSLVVVQRVRFVLSSPLEDDNVDNDIETDADIANKFQPKQKIMFKAKVVDAAGNDVTAAYGALATVKLDVTLRESSSAGSTLVNDLPEVYTGQGDSGGRFVYDASAQEFRYHLDTTGFPSGTINSSSRWFRGDVTFTWNSQPSVNAGREDVLLESK